MNKRSIFSFNARVWIWPGQNAAWHFCAVPEHESQEIKELYGKPRRGWGSVPVEATIGKTVWRTSIFPDARSGMYLLPLKLSVRLSERIADGDNITVTIRVR